MIRRGCGGYPRVAGRVPRRRRGPRPKCHLGHVHLADHDRARGAQSGDNLGVDRLRGAERVGAPRGHFSADVCVVLHRDGHAEERLAVAGGAERIDPIRLGRARSANTTAIRIQGRGFSVSIRCNVASTTSRADRAPSRIKRACSTAPA